MYDCIVIGGGPSGCAAATLVAAARFKTLLLEGDSLWRWPAGEPFAREAREMLRRLGVLDKVGSAPQDDFAVQLLQNAAARGVERRPQVRVHELLFDRGPGAAPRAIGVRLCRPDGATEDVAGRVIVEAGASAATSGSRPTEPAPRHAALWAYYRGARRDPQTAEGGALVVPTGNRKSWFWFVPLPDGVTSVGVVFEADRLAGRDSPESLLEEELCDCPAVLERLMDAELASEFHVLREAPPLAPRVAGDGWLVLDDASGLRSDPGLLERLSACELFLLLKAGELTADCVCYALAAGDTSASRLDKWESCLPAASSATMSGTPRVTK
jgi:flavin-dependent dehydrogenase